MRNSFGIGDVVRVGSGKVEYEITSEVSTGVYDLTGEKSNRKGVSWDKLTLVREATPMLTDVPVMTDDDVLALPVDMNEGTSLDLTPADGKVQQYPMPVWEVELSDAASDTKRPYLLTVDHVTTAHKSYGAACDALILASREGIEHYAVIDHQGKRLATRTAA